MRRDIEIHIKTGDTPIDPQNTFKLREFRWCDDDIVYGNGIEQPMLSRYKYAEVDIPFTVSEAKIRANGFYFAIPYSPYYKEFMIRVRRLREDGTYEYLTNEVDGSNWFLVQVGLYGGELKNVYASQLLLISETSFFVMLENGIAHLYSSSESDFNIVKANRQNANCMLACIPSNNYRYPITGVGLARWINSTNINSSKLADIIQSEFSDDGVSVQTANYNYDTEQMELELTVSGD